MTFFFFVFFSCSHMPGASMPDLFYSAVTEREQGKSFLTSVIILRILSWGPGKEKIL